MLKTPCINSKICQNSQGFFHSHAASILQQKELYTEGILLISLTLTEKGLVEMFVYGGQRNMKFGNNQRWLQPPFPQQELPNSFPKSEQNQSKQPEKSLISAFSCTPRPCWVASLWTICSKQKSSSFSTGFRGELVFFSWNCIYSNYEKWQPFHWLHTVVCENQSSLKRLNILTFKEKSI